jgi:putative aldouronate transport system permease protein
MLPAIAFMFIFDYMPMYGILLAFKDYRVGKGILGSPWVGFEHFQALFQTSIFKTVLVNTLIISFTKLLLGVFGPLCLALALNEIRHMLFKKVVQTVSYIPYFFSWIVVASLTMDILSPTRGIVNKLKVMFFGGEPVHFLASVDYFRPILYIQYLWKDVGYGSIIFLAAITSINSELYEAAEIDGAGRFQKMRFITIPGILPVVSIVFILAWGGILSGGFDQIFNMYNPVVYEVADIIDTYTYRVGIVESNFGFATAVGLFKNVVGLILVLSVNTIVKRFTKTDGIW